MKLFTLTRPDSAGNVPCAWCGLLVFIGEGVGHCDICNTDTELQAASRGHKAPKHTDPESIEHAEE